MKSYLDILKNVLENGTPKQPVRFNPDGEPIPVENGTIGTFCEIFRHDMSTGFPLLTTKKVAFKTICVELEGFIKGITDKQWYKDRKCNIWNEWANPVAVQEELSKISNQIDMIHEGNLGSDEQHDIPYPTKKEVQATLNDLGPIYGYQWRCFNKTYKTQNEDDGDWSSYTDQLKSIVYKLKENPYDRRMVCSAWNPNQIHMMALPPCHMMFNIVVYGNKLNLVWTQRSCDLFLGVPFNIASYAMFLLLLAHEANLEPGELVGELHDCHLYENQIEQAKLQLNRTPTELPTVELTHEGSIFDWTYKDVVLTNYNPQSAIKAKVIV